MTTSKTPISITAAIIVAGVAGAAVLVPNTARAGTRAEELTSLRQAAEQASWRDCLTESDYLRRSPDYQVTDDTAVAALAKPVGSLAVGATPTVKALTAECLAQAKLDPDKVRVWTDVLWTRVGSIRGDVKTMQERPYDLGYDTVAKEAADCTGYADLAAQVLGADATVTLGDWTGTIAAAKTEICAPAVKAAAEMKAKKLEPFVKAGIKNDKLKLLDETNVSVEYAVPGGGFTLDAKQLAKANPWFSESTGDDCGNGKVTTHVHRYQFDAGQKLIKESTKDYCGAVPKSAYR